MTHVPPAHLQVGASAIVETVSESQAVRLANAIDWRGKSVLMHAASRDFAEMTCVALHRTGVASRCLDGSPQRYWIQKSPAPPRYGIESCHR